MSALYAVAVMVLCCPYSLTRGFSVRWARMCGIALCSTNQHTYRAHTFLRTPKCTAACEGTIHRGWYGCCWVACVYLRGQWDTGAVLSTASTLVVSANSRPRNAYSRFVISIWAFYFCVVPTQPPHCASACSKRCGLLTKMSLLCHCHSKLWRPSTAQDKAWRPAHEQTAHFFILH